MKTSRQGIRKHLINYEKDTARTAKIGLIPKISKSNLQRHATSYITKHAIKTLCNLKKLLVNAAQPEIEEIDVIPYEMK